MKRIFSLIMIFISFFSFSQKIISGVIKDTEGSVVSSASVTVEEPGKDAIIAYGISNSKGEYKVTFSSAEPNVEVKIKAFNHKPMVKPVRNDTQNVNFTLESEVTEIKEVVLKTKIITKKGDTIAYDLKAFESKSDRTLADVLKKMPGIEVNTDGSILYQGNPINKFYVNGKDLMEGGYGTINNSLPKDAVQKVEVLENHQPVKILQDKVASDAAAINIKLKNSVTMTGRAEVGTGFASPWLWNLKLTPMFFGQKNQWVLNYKTNNVGETVENEGNMLAFGSAWEGRRSQNVQNDWLNVENAATPNLPEKRYLMNNVHYVSANLLTNPFKNQEWELKANTSYTSNAVTREAFTEANDYQLGTHTVANMANKFYTDKLKGELIFTKNEKKGFFKNTTTFNQYWNADRANVLRNAASASEAIESPTTSFENSLSTILPWKQKMVNLKSYLSYQSDRQNLDVSPGNYVKFNYYDTGGNVTTIGGGSNLVQQLVSVKDFEADHSANISFTKKNWTITPEVGLNFNRVVLNSDLYGVSSSDPAFFTNGALNNDVTFTQAVPYTAIGINYKSDAWMLYSNIPLNFNNIKAEDPARNLSKSLSKITFKPNLFLQYSFASFWKASASASMANTLGSMNNMYAGYILSSPTSINAMSIDNPIMETNNKSAGAKLEYRNPLNNLFFNVDYRYSNTRRNLTASPNASGAGFALTTYIERENTADSNNFSAEVGKYFPKFKTNASVSYNNNTGNSEYLRNNALLTNKNNNQAFGFKFNNTYFSWLSVDFSMTASRSKNSGFSSSRSRAYNHNLSLYLYPLENHTVSFNWDQINSGTASQRFNNQFFDISYQYTWAKRKIDFELKWLNIANRKIFERYNVSDIGDSYTRIQLRPSQVMLTVKFNFK